MDIGAGPDVIVAEQLRSLLRLANQEIKSDSKTSSLSAHTTARGRRKHNACAVMHIESSRSLGYINIQSSIKVRIFNSNLVFTSRT